MTMMTLTQAAALVPGSRLVGDGTVALQRVHSDTRTLGVGDLFVALKGERFDANEFLPEALARGAAAAIAHPGRLIGSGLPGLEVPDTRAALGQLAANWRAQFTLPLIAVTGSNGKTTVTQMIAAIMRASCDDRALATAGNFNNDIGVPLTLLRLRARHCRAVLELGMNHPGEIARLAALARPTIALVNNAQREHQEFMQSLEAVARENAAVFAALPDDGTAVYPEGDPFTGLWRELAGKGVGRRCLSFGESASADVSLLGAVWQHGAWTMQAATPLGSVEARLNVAGRHNLHNALAACACTLAAGMGLAQIADGLSSFEPVKGRSRAIELERADGSPLTLIDDSYNANPDSVRAAIDVLASLPGPRLLALGDMGEVGERGAEFHAEVGAYARERGIESLYAVGGYAACTVDAFGGEVAARRFESIAALAQAVLVQLPELRSVVVKGSRFMQMEQVVDAITAFLSGTHEEERSVMRRESGAARC